MPPTHLHAVATATPPHVLTQAMVKEGAARIFGDTFPQFPRLSSAYDHAGIDTRYSVVPFEWFFEPHTWPERTAAFMRGAQDLFVDAAQAALAQAGWQARDVDCVVTICSTGIATPSLEACVHGRMGFRSDILRVPVFGIGCAGGISGLGIAERLARATPGAKVLMVAVETCTLAFRFDRAEKADIIASALFGDGAAAVCVSTDGPGRITLGSGHQTLWPDTLNVMGWDVDETGFGVVLNRSVPAFVGTHFADAAAAAQDATGVARVDRYVCHPGGAKVLTALEEATGLPDGALDAERAILRDYGNMSAPTVLFILNRVLQMGQTGTLMACAMGPGFSASFLPIHVAAA